MLSFLWSGLNARSALKFFNNHFLKIFFSIIASVMLINFLYLLFAFSCHFFYCVGNSLKGLLVQKHPEKSFYFFFFYRKALGKFDKVKIPHTSSVQPTFAHLPQQFRQL